MAKQLIQFVDYLSGGGFTDHWPNATGGRGTTTTGRWGSPYVAHTFNSNGNSNSYPPNSDQDYLWDTKSVGADYADGAVTFAIALNLPNAGRFVIQIGDSTTCQMTFILDFQNNRWEVWRGTTSGTQLVNQTMSGSVVRAGSIFNAVQIAWKIDPSNGYAWIRCNGNVEVNSTSLNTRNSANSWWNRTIFTTSGGGGDTYIDSPGWWYLDGDDPATLNRDFRTWFALPNGDDSVQFSRSGGSFNYDRLNQNSSDGDSSYTYSSTVGHIDRFTVSSSWVPLGADIWGARVTAHARIDDATPWTFRAKLWSGSATLNLASYGLPSSYSAYRYCRPDSLIVNDPDTSARWGTTNAIRSIKIGYENVSSP